MTDLEVFYKVHHKYISSIDWYVVSKHVINRDGDKCRVCGKHTDKLIIHHTSYEHFMEGGVLEENDCIPVCSACHRNIHRCKKHFEKQMVDWVNKHTDEIAEILKDHRFKKSAPKKDIKRLFN